MTLPMLYSFRRCPYAMRARLALASAGISCELREVVLRDKPAEMLAASPKGTVPVLVTEEGLIEESLDIMLWALERADPEDWLELSEMSQTLIAIFDGPFKSALDRYKYSTRYADADRELERGKAVEILAPLEEPLSNGPWMFGQYPRLADFALLPFVRQFANTDRAWFDAQDWPAIRRWLSAFEASERFAAVMVKYPQWQPGQERVCFP